LARRGHDRKYRHRLVGVASVGLYRELEPFLFIFGFAFISGINRRVQIVRTAEPGAGGEVRTKLPK